MLKKTLIACALVAMIPAAAMAQPEGEEPATDGTGGESGGAATGEAGAAASDAMAPSGGGPEIFQKGAMGISFGLPSGGFSPAGTLNLTYFANEKTAYDLIAGLSFSHGDVTDPVTGMTSSQDLLGLTLGFGYRMYKKHSGKVDTFLEPQVLIRDTDMTNAFADTLSIGVGAGLGAEVMFTDWFSVSGQIGAGLSFEDKFKTINFTTLTSGLAATIYWK